MPSLTQFIQPADAPGDLTPALVRASAALRDGDTLVFPEGVFELRPEGAAAAAWAITNHDLQMRLLALHLQGLRDITLEGTGCTLRVSGMVSPLWFRECAGLVIRGLTLDRLESFNLLGEVLDVSADRVELRLDPAWNPSWSAWAGVCRARGPWWEEKVEAPFEWDPATRAPAPGSVDCLGGWGHHFTYATLGPDRLAVLGPSRHRPRVGHYLMLRTHRRPAPGIALDDCRETRLEGVTVHAAGGMAVIAQRCREIVLRGCAVEPSPRGPGIYADCCDATHFANCAGRVVLQDCRFLAQLDDATNVHGAYFPVVRRTGRNSLLVERRHDQQAGAPVAGAGDCCELVRRENLETYWSGRVSRADSLNPHVCSVEFAETLPDDLRPGDALDNVDWYPELVVRGCTVARNRARGVLVATRRPAIVEHCRFAVSGAAIQSGGGLGYWCESGPVRDLTIRHNTFEHCASEPEWGRGVLDFGVESGAAAVRTAPYHRGIRVIGNRFVGCGDRLWHGVATAPAEWSDNLVED